MRISVLSSVLPKLFTLIVSPVIVVLNELVELKQLLLKESMLLEELLLSPTRDSDISLFAALWGW